MLMNKVKFRHKKYNLISFLCKIFRARNPIIYNYYFIQLSYSHFSITYLTVYSLIKDLLALVIVIVTSLSQDTESWPKIGTRSSVALFEFQFSKVCFWDKTK